MTQDEIIEMARQTSDATKDARGRESFCFDSYGLEAFAKLVAQHEREACANVCEQGVNTEHPTVKGHIMNNFGKSELLAEAIRARGQA